MLTFGCEAGKEKSLTLPKSSPVQITRLSCVDSHELMSVPSAFSGHIPMVWNDRVHVLVSHSTSLRLDVAVTWRHVEGFPKT